MWNFTWRFSWVTSYWHDQFLALLNEQTRIHKFYLFFSNVTRGPTSSQVKMIESIEVVFLYTQSCGMVWKKCPGSSKKPMNIYEFLCPKQIGRHRRMLQKAFNLFGINRSWLLTRSIVSPERIQKQRRGIKWCSIMLLGIFTKGENYCIDRHFHDRKEQGCHDVSCRPAKLQK